MPRILSLWLPQLPLDRYGRMEDPRLSGPFAISAVEKNAWRITHANAFALKAGVSAGLSLADARAVCPDLLTESCDLVREDLLLRALWRWADQFSPRVALDKPDGLLLDIAGCAHLFGGERAMGHHIRTSLLDLKIISRIGIADTKGAARALARFGNALLETAKEGATRNALQHLPITALGLSAQINHDLARTGLRTIGELYAIKSSELARRFGVEIVQALHAAIGRAPDPVSPKAADPVYAARMTLPEPIGLSDDIEEVIARLARRVCEHLQRDNKGARQFELVIRCVDTGDHPMTIGFARPCFEPAPILRQFVHPVGKLKITYGADWFRLVAKSIEPIRLRQSKIGEEAKQNDQRSHLIDTLGNRLGFDHVRVFKAQDSHLPEREFAQVEVANADDTNWKAAPRKRPIRLYRPPQYVQIEKTGRPPQQFQWQRKSYETKTAHGPERLTPAWHDANDLRTRDYWRVETVQGPRLWLLTYPATQPPVWYVAGRFP